MNHVMNITKDLKCSHDNIDYCVKITQKYHTALECGSYLGHIEQDNHIIHLFSSNENKMPLISIITCADEFENWIINEYSNENDDAIQMDWKTAIKEQWDEDQEGLTWEEYFDTYWLCYCDDDDLEDLILPIEITARKLFHWNKI